MGREVQSSFFFFSSRRRHTRFDCDWSSDVCSSDLVVEGELGAQHLREIEGVALLVAQVTAYQRLADHALAYAGGAEVIALTGIELERDVRFAVGRVDDQLVADEARVEIAVGGRGALQVGLDRLVGGVLEALA